MTQEDGTVRRQPGAEVKPPAPTFGAAIARGTALFMGVFTLLNLVIAVRHPGYDANLWWIDMFPLPQFAPFVAGMVLLYMTIVWLAYAFSPDLSDWRRRVTRTSIELLALFVGWNILHYYMAILRGSAHSPLPVPFLVFVLLLLMIVWRGALAERSARGGAAWGVMAATAVVLAGIVPVLQILLFGVVDHSGRWGSTQLPADAVVVLGGAPEAQLEEGVKVAADLCRSNAKKRISGKFKVDGAEDKFSFVLTPGPGQAQDPATGKPATSLTVDGATIVGKKGLHYTGTYTDASGATREATLDEFKAVDGRVFGEFSRKLADGSSQSVTVTFTLVDGVNTFRGDPAAGKDLPAGVGKLHVTEGEAHQPILILAGTPEQTQTMRAIAVRQGVSNDLIVTGSEGTRIEAANRQLGNLDTTERKASAIVVGSFYELPRIRMSFWREDRIVLTVPIPGPTPGAAGAVLKEAGALWKYYLDAAVRQ